MYQFPCLHLVNTNHPPSITHSSMSAQYGGMSVEQVLLTDSVVGLLCDRGGEKLSQLQAQSGCRIQLAQERHGPEHRICTLTGPPSAIALAKGALQGASQPPPQASPYGQASQLTASIQQYSQQAAYYRQLGMAREADELERQVALWTQMAQQQQQQQMIMAQQQQMAQYYRAMAGAGAGMPGGGEPQPHPTQRSEEQED